MKKYLIAILMILLGLGCTISGTVVLVDNSIGTETKGGFSEEGETENPEDEKVGVQVTRRILYLGITTDDRLYIYVNGSHKYTLYTRENSNCTPDSGSNYSSFTFTSGDIVRMRSWYAYNYTYEHDCWSDHTGSGYSTTFKEIWVKIGSGDRTSDWLISCREGPGVTTVTYDAYNGSFTGSQSSSQNCTTYSRTLCTLGGRNFYTPSYSGSAYKYVGYATTEEGWGGALVVSTDSSAVSYYTAYNTSNRYGYNGSITYDGSTYYYGGSAERMQNQIDTSMEHTHIYSATLASAAQELLSTARRYVYTETPYASSGCYYDLPGYSPTRTGYSFSGWYTATSGGSRVTASTLCTNSARHTLYAQWSASSYTNYFYVQGGTFSSSNLSSYSYSYSSLTTYAYKSITYASTYGTLPTPTRTGYTFKGWYTATSGGSQITSSTTNYTASSRSLYAQWTPISYTVTLSTNSGTAYNSSGTAITSITVAFDSTYGVPTNVVRTGYTFVGWFKSGYSTQVTTSTTKTTTGNETLYAKWRPLSATVTIYQKTSTDGTTWSNSAVTSTIRYYYYAPNTTSNAAVQQSGVSSETATITASLQFTNVSRNSTFSIYSMNLPSGYTLVDITTATTPSYTTSVQSPSYSLSISTSTTSASIYIYLRKNTNPLKYGNDRTDTYISNYNDNDFAVNDAGLYESQIYGQHDGAAFTYFYFTKQATDKTLTFHIYLDSEVSCDDAVFGYIDESEGYIEPYNNYDSDYFYWYSGYEAYESGYYSIVYDISGYATGSTHYVPIKYQKDSSVNTGRDSLQFAADFGQNYFYFESGQYPQTYVGSSLNSSLNSATTSQLTSAYTIKYNNGSSNQTLQAYTYSSTGGTYVPVKAAKAVTIDGVTFSANATYWFKCDPIRWRASNVGVSLENHPSTWNVYGQNATRITASHKILGAGAVLAGNMTQGYAYTSSSLFSNVNTLTATVYGNYAASTTWACETYAGPSVQMGVTTSNQTATIAVASETNVSYSSSSDYRAQYTQFAALIIGMHTSRTVTTKDYSEYFTRDLGSNINSMTGINKSGQTCNLWANQVNGYRLAIYNSGGTRIC
ncbi:MAG: hypothetical protein E7375_02230 [Clostridiales bacterium]|nr:hypothetical protein [Clostridiales bacterium]